MKKIILLIILPILLLFSGCSKYNENSLNKDKNNKAATNNSNNIKNQKYSFGPMADISKIDDGTKKYLQDFLNKLGDPPKDKITFEVMGAEFKNDGSLEVNVFVRNGNSDTVYNLDTTLQLIENNMVVATADFKFNLEEFGELPKDTSRPWTILYYPEDIKNKGAEISNPIIKCIKCEYEY